MQKEIKNLSDDINGVLLMNIGTPSAPTTTGIRRFLKEFLSDNSNWEFVNFEGKQENNKDKPYLRPIAVNA